MNLYRLIIFSLLTFVFSSLQVSAYDLSDFPKMFVNAQGFNGIAVSSPHREDVMALLSIESSLITYYKTTYQPDCEISAIPEVFNCKIDAPAKLPGEVSNLQQNMISVGGPCANNVTAKIMGMPNTWPECAFGFTNGTSKIRIYNKWNRTQVIIAGYSADDTKLAANTMRDYLLWNFTGYELEITGNPQNPYISRLLTEEEQKDCKRNEDCVIVKADCCGCSGGGAVQAILNNSVAEWNFYQKKECSGMACIAVMSQHISCFSKPACVANTCQLLPVKSSVCNSELFENCDGVSENWIDVIQPFFGTSCKEVLSLCK